MSLQTEPLFVGATRPSMKFGVTVEFLLANLMIGMTLFIATHKLYMLLVMVPLHGIAFLLCRSEPRTLSLLGLWAKTKGSSLNRGHWKASSASPLPIVKRTMKMFPLLAAYNRENEVTRYTPYTVHTDEATIRTSNGELLRIFRIEGVAHESADDDDLNSWQLGMNTMLRNIADPCVALHTHIIRRVKNDYPAATFAPGFAADLNEKYKLSLQDTRMLVNELYLTAIYNPNLADIVKPNVFTRAFEGMKLLFVQPNRDAIFDKSEDAAHKMNELSQQIAQALQRYQPTLLKLYTHESATVPGLKVTCSQPIELLAYLINGEQLQMPVPQAKIKAAVAVSRPMIGKEAIEQRGLTTSVISGIVGIKEYPNVTLSTMLNGLLAAPYELVVSQSFSCLSKGAATGRLTRQRDVMINAGDLAESQIVQLDEALDDLTSNQFTMGMHNLTLQVKADNIKTLSDNLAHARTTLSDVGMVIAREDLALEASFWSMLPCNFGLRPRPAPITSRNFGGFASLHNYPMGKPTGNHWGEAVALLKTASGAPYYFSFHRADLGNTTIIGPSGSGKTVTQGFLIAMLEKFSPTLVFFDKDRGAEIFIRAQGGFYMPLKNGQATGFNPFQRPLTDDYQLFLQKLIKTLVSPKDEEYTIRDERAVADAIRGVYALPQTNRRIGMLMQFLDPTVKNGVAERLSKWCNSGQMAWVFDNKADTLDYTSSRLYGFDITEFLDNPEVRTPIILYLFQRMEQVIDGRRFVCFIDEFWKALQDSAFEDFVQNKLKTIRKQNGFLVTGTQSPSDTLRSPIAKTIIEQSPTQIFMPNPKADYDDYVGGFKLTEREFEIVRTLPETSRRFLVKQGDSSVVAELNLRGFDDELAVLSGTTANVHIVEKAIEQAGSNPADWLPVFHRMRKAA